MNGGELLGLSLGGCLWNDLHNASEKLGIDVDVQAIEAEVDVEGDPMRIPRMRVEVAMRAETLAKTQTVFDTAVAASALVAALQPGVSLSIALKGATP